MVSTNTCELCKEIHECNANAVHVCYREREREKIKMESVCVCLCVSFVLFIFSREEVPSSTKGGRPSGPP